MLIDKTYFSGDLAIPNVTLENSGIGAKVDFLIEKHEVQFLTDALGYAFQKAFTAGLEEEPIEQRWIDLRDGKEYNMASGELVRWQGLIITGTEGKRSPIANYVYYRYMRSNETQSTSGGEKRSQTENAVDASAALKMVRAWNEMCCWIQEMYVFLNYHTDDYPEWKLRSCNRFLRINQFNI